MSFAENDEMRMKGFAYMCLAIHRIRAGREFTEIGLTSFQQCCEEYWRISWSAGKRLAVVGAIVDALKGGDPKLLPTAAEHVLPLARFLNQDHGDEKIVEVWEMAIEKAPKNPRGVPIMTREHVTQVLNTFVLSKQPPPKDAPLNVDPETPEQKYLKKRLAVFKAACRTIWNYEDSAPELMAKHGPDELGDAFIGCIEWWRDAIREYDRLTASE